jgi:alanine racemase
MAEFSALLEDNFIMEGLNISLLMSHLACADEPSHPMNARQCAAFLEVRRRLPGIPASFANSSGIFLGKDFTHDLVRPGIALYGGNPLPGFANPMRPVAHLAGTVLQVREVAVGDSVGYGATWIASMPSRIAVLGAGYKDGIPRALSSREPKGPAQVSIGGVKCPVVGRISMDMMGIDVSALPASAVARGTRVEIIGDRIAIDDAAAWAGTISYELLTRLGQRYARVYSEAESESRS